MDITSIKELAKRMRLRSLTMAYKAGKNGAHLGGGLSLIEIMAVLYGGVLNINPETPINPERDIVLMGKGHGVLAYYTALYEAGFISKEDIDSFEKEGSLFIGHPVKDISKGIEYSSGSLGMALSVGVGMAISAKNRKSHRKIYVIMGDGECQEGSSWEACFLAAKYQLDNLVIFVDNNRIQSDGFSKDICGYDNLEEKFAAFGCEVKSINGHSVEALLNALEYHNYNKPNVIIANTIKGKGVSFMENNYKWHHSVLNKSQYETALAEVRSTYAGG